MCFKSEDSFSAHMTKKKKKKLFFNTAWKDTQYMDYY